MSAYYRDHVAYSTVASGSYDPDLVNASATPVSPNDVALRICSVKACGTTLEPDYTLKMCDACRERHRIYATTKRLKRKMEKAAMGAQTGQPVVWMPPDDMVDDERTRHHVSAVPASVSTPESPLHASTMATPHWNSQAIDPRLFSQSSELANALTLPVSATQSPRNAGNTQLAAHKGAAAGPSTITNGHGSSPTTKQSDLTATENILDGPLRPRFCSIKGCKAQVSGSSFFKMCEPCRGRYRNYGTTKRAKWKKEKEVAVAELDKMKAEQSKSDEQGASPVSSDHELSAAWLECGADAARPREASTSASTMPSASALLPKMCTVSHCREILPGDYQYLRCERHRIQNRHHSKLKRVRDKESKAQAFEWHTMTSGRSGDDREASDVSGAEPDLAPDAALGEDTPLGEPRSGIPPAARGTRRTNHVCSIKACYNLLSPSNPWKMCDLCRARDREIRRWKALRDSGHQTEPPEGLVPREARSENMKKKKGKKVDVAAEDSSSTQSPESTGVMEGTSTFPVVPAPSQLAQPSFLTDLPDSTELVFMEPLLPTEPEDLTASPAASEQCSTPTTDVTGVASVSTDVPSPTITQGPVAGSDPAPPKKKTTKRKTRPSNEGGSSTPTSAGPSTNPPGVLPSTGQTTQDRPAQSLQPPNGVTAPPANSDVPANAPGMPYMPYYLPSVYGMPPYPIPHQYARGPHPQGSYPYLQMPPPYPCTPHPYTMYAPPPPPPHSSSTAQHMYSVSSEFVARTGYAAPSQGGAAPHGGPDGSYLTFSARTGEPHHRAAHTPSLMRRKRLVDQISGEALGANKRLAIESEQSTATISTLSEPMSPDSTPTQGSATGSGDQRSADETTEQHKAGLQTCSNKICRRQLPAETVGTVCSRCRERAKKRAAKAKQRFKLEPKRLLIRPARSSDSVTQRSQGKDAEAAEAAP